MRIQLKNVSKRYNEIENALIDINLDLNSDYPVFIVGESGAGKSTLLRILSLIDTDFYGEVDIDGVSARNLNERTIARIRNEEFGYVFQDLRLVENESVYENVRIPLIYSKKYKFKEHLKLIESALSVVEMSGKQDCLVKELSGGEKQRVSIARAIVNSPNILILDEPTGALNKRLSDQVMSYVYTYSSIKKKGLIIVTHDLDKIKLGIGRVVTVDSGTIISDEIL